MRVDGRNRRAHRVAYELAYRPIPDGQIIRHMCHNPSCVNPEHLRIGTQTDNSRDMVKAGNHHYQKLMPDEAFEIRRAFAAGGITQKRLARLYGVSPGAVRQIISNKTFTDETYTPPPTPMRRPRGSLLRALNEDSAKEIRRLYLAGGVSHRSLAEQFQLNQAIISDVLHNKRYFDPDYTPLTRRAYNQKISEEQADVIREKVASGVSQGQLSREYRVGQGLISQIIAGKIHKGKARRRSPKPQEKTISRAPLRLIKGPAPTSLYEQRRRQTESRTRNIRRPRRKPGDPLITETDGVLDPKSGCHNWRWGTTARGSITVEGGNRKLAYRVAWEMAHGPIPEGKQINHHCNNPRCINVEHLYVGDQFENMRDVARDGYHAHANRKLTWAQVRAIRVEYKPGKTTYKQLGDKHDVTEGAIYCIISNKTFRDPHYTPNNPQESVRRKLSMADANDIRRRFQNEGVTHSALALEKGVSRPTVSNIIRNEIYFDPIYTPPPSE